ncbi:MAG: LemA family protein [Bacteroidales bacterium]|nr:LemA family protein [Candidatus Cacconaster merdequi]
MTLIIVIAILAIIVLWMISVQRNLVSKEEICKNSLSQIGVQQASRWDALKALAEMTKSYSDYEYKTITDVIAQRKTITGASSVADANEQEKLMSTAMNHINVVAEQYPQLKASDTYVKTMDSINTYENQVRMSRMVFNDSVTSYNRVVRQFPSSIVAGILGFAVKDYLVENAGKSEMPSMKI